MAESRFAVFAGLSDIGEGMKKNEDYLSCTELGEDALLAIVADGAGSGEAKFQPAAITANHVNKVIRRIYEKDRDILFSHMPLFLEQACQTANDALIAFKIGDEERHGGFATTITGCMIHRSGRIAIMHAGNSRMYLIREGKLNQFTRDQTEAQDLVDRGIITPEQYYTDVNRLSLKNGIGITPHPYITANEFMLKRNDVVVLTTDGVHYSFQDEVMKDVILQADNVEDACRDVVGIARKMKDGYADNISIIVIQFMGGKQDEN